jgi:hypothetical protein
MLRRLRDWKLYTRRQPGSLWGAIAVHTRRFKLLIELIPGDVTTPLDREARPLLDPRAYGRAS